MTKIVLEEQFTNDKARELAQGGSVFRRLNRHVIYLDQQIAHGSTATETMQQYPQIEMDTCTNKVNLTHLDIPHGMCVDKKLVERITGYQISARKDKNQRNICNCIESIDIGTYESCLNGCIYCYAIKGNYNTAEFNNRRHDPASPMLLGHPAADDVIKDRVVKSLRDDQYSLF